MSTAPARAAQGVSTTGPARAPLSHRRDDLYETPPEATAALLGAERLPRVFWEPAAGRGAIVDVLRKAGHHVIATDLVDYGVPIAPPFHCRRDFLLELRASDGVEVIITNPPFKLANEFVEHALELVPKVCMLLRLAFLESEGRTEILERRGLARVHVFRNRLPRMHRDGWAGPQASSNTAFAWFVWERAHNGPPELHRLSWQRRNGGVS